MKVEYSRYNSALFIDSKINQILVTQCNLWVGVLGWIRDLEWCPIEAVLEYSRDRTSGYRLNT